MIMSSCVCFFFTFSAHVRNLFECAWNGDFNGAQMNEGKVKGGNVGVSAIIFVLFFVVGYEQRYMVVIFVESYLSRLWGRMVNITKPKIVGPQWLKSHITASLSFEKTQKKRPQKESSLISPSNLESWKRVDSQNWLDYVKLYRKNNKTDHDEGYPNIWHCKTYLDITTFFHTSFK